MKIFNCLTKNGIVKKMTLNKVIQQKRKGSPVQILNVAEVIKKEKHENIQNRPEH